VLNRRVLGVACGVAAWLGCVGAAAAQSDSCGTATAVTQGTYLGSNIGATADGSSTCGLVGERDVWYVYTAPATGIVRIDTCGSTLDTVLSVHTGCPGAPVNQVACSDDGGCQLVESSVMIQVVAGVSYRVRVSGFGVQTGAFQLTVGPVLQATGSDSCGGATVIGAGVYSGMLTTATADGSDSCNGSNSPDRWYAFTAPAAGMLVLNTCGSDHDTVVSVHSACPGGTNNQLVCNDDDGGCGRGSMVSVQTQAGVTYRIRVAGRGGLVGGYVLNVGFGANNACDGATPVSVGTIVGTTVGATTDGATVCGNATGPDVWYRFTAPLTGTVRFSTCGSGLDTVLSLHSACPATPANTLACSDVWTCSFEPSESAAVVRTVVAGESFYIRVAGKNGAAGAYELKIGSVFAGSPQCWTAPPLTMGSSFGYIDGYVLGQGLDLCGASGSPERWYSFTAPASGTLSVDTCTSDGLAISVHTGCPGDITNLVTCAAAGSCGFGSSLTTAVTAGTTYRVRIAGYPISPFYRLNASFTPGADTCETAAPISVGMTAGTTAGAVNEGTPNACGGQATSPDVWYVYTATEAGLLTVDACGSGFDTLLAVYGGCPATLDNALACNDDGPACGVQARVVVPVTAGQQYRIRVSGFGGQSGAFVLNVSLGGCRADYNQDGVINSNDISAFLTGWLQALAGGC
jgi:hypothetical protein